MSYVRGMIIKVSFMESRWYTLPSQHVRDLLVRSETHKESHKGVKKACLAGQSSNIHFIF